VTTDIERFNLYWLSNVMTAPVASAERYYYDAHTKKLFAERSGALFDMVGLALTGPAAQRLGERLAGIDSEASEVVEIPRLNVRDKVSVQLLFPSKLPGIIHEEKLRFAAEQQQDGQGFVLDKLEAMDPALLPLSGYWEDFKLKTIQYYLEKFTGITVIAPKMF